VFNVAIDFRYHIVYWYTENLILLIEPNTHFAATLTIYICYVVIHISVLAVYERIVEIKVEKLHCDFNTTVLVYRRIKHILIKFVEV